MLNVPTLNGPRNPSTAGALATSDWPPHSGALRLSTGATITELSLVHTLKIVDGPKHGIGQTKCTVITRLLDGPVWR